MLLTSYGTKQWLTILVVSLLLALAAAWWNQWWAVVLVAVVCLALLSFFRDPLGRAPATSDPRDMISPADGTVSAVFTADSHEATGNAPALVIRIFLSVLNVHINRAPCDGEVVAIVHRPGKYLDARTEESARVNESNLIVLRAANGQTIGIRQVSGAIARRIVCPLRVGDRLKRGERFGMITFGSTTELVLPHPEQTRSMVKKGDGVTGGVTVVAQHVNPAS
ncbi:MAG: phosphatidylserine decarboxylase [Phycisphaerae bacterium]|nr:phosphatidylserine decarboxylase [Phycisphaerae bacterium]